jgi:putative addiction module component (TIGR02574 family)
MRWWPWSGEGRVASAFCFLDRRSTWLSVFERIDQGERRVDHRGPSIFDLSPAEKLQLVEDLWDDLAGTPEAVPLHDWQKQELARRKANLLKNPASGCSWEDVKQRTRGSTWVHATRRPCGVRPSGPPPAFEPAFFKTPGRSPAAG